MLLQPMFRDDEDGHWLDRDRGRRVRSGPEEGDFTEEIALPQPSQDALLAVFALAHLDGPLMHEVGFIVRGIALPKDDIPRVECPGLHW